jgi:catechol-2,3-dioxygenase
MSGSGARIFKTPGGREGSMPGMTTNRTLIGRIQAVVVDCARPTALADFYRGLLGGEITESTDNYAALTTQGQVLAFQHVQDAQAATWPNGGRRVHLDIVVPDTNRLRKQLAEMGAVEPEFQPGGEDWIVFLDPEGHPFCVMEG